MHGEYKPSCAVASGSTTEMLFCREIKARGMVRVCRSDAAWANLGMPEMKGRW